MSRKRTPSNDDMALWERVTESVAPLEPRRPPAKAIAISPPPPGKKPAALVVPPAKPTPPKAPPSLAPLDRRMRSRLSRGSVAIDRRIDLHGLTQLAAERRLDTFLHDAQTEGARVVLVITGKGRPDESGAREERGVLRRMVPLWLAAPGLRSLVVGFEEAARQHGGSGALYVRIRRPRG